MSRSLLTLLGCALLCSALTAQTKPQPPDKVKKVEKAGETKMLNPQPEPPAAKKKKLLKPGETKMLNPQPEPPAKSVKKPANPGEATQLNPQPEPPKPAKPAKKQG